MNFQSFDRIIIAESHKWEIPGMDWEDIAQEVRIKLWQNEKQFDPTKSSYKTWANRVMINCIKDIAKASRTKKAKHLNNAINIDWLMENGLNITEKRKLYDERE